MSSSRQGKGTATKKARPGNRKERDSESTAASIAERNQLVERYIDYVEVVVDGLIRAMRLPKARKDEFLSAGMFGLIDAAGRYNPALNTDFRSFSFLRIRGAVIDFIRQSCDLNGYEYRRLKVLEMAQESRELDLQRRTNLNERDRIKVAKEGIQHLERVAVMFQLVNQSEEEEANAPEQDRLDLERNLEKRRKYRKIREIVATLPEKERIIIEQHYFQDRKLFEVAEQFSGLSKSWVSRLHDRAIDMLRERIVKFVPELAA